MSVFTSKWLNFTKISSNGTDRTDAGTTVSCVSSKARKIYERNAPVSESTLVEILYSFLSPRLEIIALNYSKNPLTYRALEQDVYAAFKDWSRAQGFVSFGLYDFRTAMLQLFPEPNAKFDPVAKEWWGFRFHPNCIIHEETYAD